MFKRAYIPKKFALSSKEVIVKALRVLDEYEAQGFDLTLRQLYYQFVSRGWLANSDKNYKRLGSIVNDARLAGLIDWDRIEDRTRELEESPKWNDPAHLIDAAAKQFRVDVWADQPTRIEVWIEKDALVGVIDGVCRENGIAYFSCRGYASQSEMWRAGRRLGAYLDHGQAVKILHMGDHDPSGLDMSRDIEERLFRFMAVDNYQDKMTGSGGRVQDSIDYVREMFTLDRIALNMDQVEEFNPPPNPAKLSDSRGLAYVQEYGDESWELDALDPATLAGLIQDGIDDVLDHDLMADAIRKQERQREALTEVSDRWGDVLDFLGRE